MKIKNIEAMKKSHHIIIKIFLLIIVAVSFSACNDEVDTGQDLDIRGVSIIPNPVEIGQKVSVNGFNFQNAISIEFPENITVSTFDKVGEHQLDVIVPSGTVSGGNIIVNLPDNDFLIPIELKLLAPKVTKTYPLSGATEVGPTEILVILGEDLINVSEIVFPGERQATVGEMDFYRKGNEEIRVIVPTGTESGIGTMTLKTKYGTVFVSTPVEFSGGGFVPEEYQFLTGEDGLGKVWTWDKKREDGVLFGSGAYQRDTWPGWWPLKADNIHQGVGRSNAIGAKMFFSYSSLEKAMTKILVDGTEIHGFYELDMTETKDNVSDGTPWSIGMLRITGGDPELSILGGSNVKDFDILEIDENKLILSADFGGTGYFFFFGAVEDD